MPVSVKLDEALSEALAEPLEQRGYDVATVRSQGWGGLKDSDLWPRVVAEARFFITADKGFGDIRKYKPGTHAGILVLRPERESLVLFRRLLETTLAAHPLESFTGTVSVATSRGVRRRLPPSNK